MRRKRNKQQIKIILGLSICLLLIMTVGYAAFSTNLTLSAKGNIKDYNAAWQLIKKLLMLVMDYTLIIMNQKDTFIRALTQTTI